MDSIVSHFASYGIDFWYTIKVSGFLLLAAIVLTLAARLIFGKKSNLNCAISSAIGILFLYVATVLLMTFVPQWGRFLNPLPLTTISNDYLTLFSFQNADYATICSQLLSLVILSFFMNITQKWIPKGKNIFTWFFFRLLTIVLGLLFHGIVTYLFINYLPQGLVYYAPTVLLAILILMLLTGALKLVVGAVMTTVNPLIAVLYTFFFASFVGKQVTRAVLTTALVAGLVYLMNYLGIASLYIAAGALTLYIPFIVALTGMWYVSNKAI